jgi:hypothetical protein
VLSGRGLCDELIARPVEPYRLWCVVVCDLETSWMRRPWPELGRSAKKKYLSVIAVVNFEAGVSLGVGFILLCVWLRLLSLTLPRSSKVLSLRELPFAWCWHPSICTASCCSMFLTAVQVSWYEVWQGSRVTILWQYTRGTEGPRTFCWYAALPIAWAYKKANVK